jgi:putative ABC transport system substrate-binding protein
MQRRSFLAQGLLLGAAATTRRAAAAQRPVGGRRLAALLFDGPEVWKLFETELRTELAALGWTEGKNLDMQWHYANGDGERLRSLATDLVATRPDAIVVRGTPATNALHRATTSIPILTGVGDPIGAGFARTFAAPGGNITGISWATTETSLKQIDVLRALVPRLTMLHVVLPADREPFVTDLTRPIESAAQKAGLATRVRPVSTLVEMSAAFRSEQSNRNAAAFVFAFSRIEPKSLADVALASGMPTMFEHRTYVEAGGLASYRFYWDNQTRRAAAQIDKVFRGERPAQIPFELPTLAELVLNRSTARALGLKLPQPLLLQANAIVA